MPFFGGWLAAFRPITIAQKDPAKETQECFSGLDTTRRLRSGLIRLRQAMPMIIRPGDPAAKLSLMAGLCLTMRGPASDPKQFALDETRQNHCCNMKDLFKSLSGFIAVCSGCCGFRCLMRSSVQTTQLSTTRMVNTGSCYGNPGPRWSLMVLYATVTGHGTGQTRTDPQVQMLRYHKSDMWIGQELTDLVLCNLFCNVSIPVNRPEYVETAAVDQISGDQHQIWTSSSQGF